MRRVLSETIKRLCNLNPMFKRQMNTPANECIATKSQPERHCNCIQLFCICLFSRQCILPAIYIRKARIIQWLIKEICNSMGHITDYLVCQPCASYQGYIEVPSALLTCQRLREHALKSFHVPRLARKQRVLYPC